MIIVVMMIVFRIFKSILKTMTSLRQRQFFNTHFIIQRSTIMIVCTKRHQEKLVNNFIIIKVVALPGGMTMANYIPSRRTRVYLHGFLWESCCSIVESMCSVSQIIVFFSVFVQALYFLSCDLRLLITPSNFCLRPYNYTCMPLFHNDEYSIPYRYIP